MIRRLLAIDHDKLELRLAGYAIIGILLATALEAIVGVGALQTGVAAVVVVVVGRTGDLRTRMVHMGAVTLIGSIASRTVLVSRSGDAPIGSGSHVRRPSCATAPPGPPYPLRRRTY
jgi:hypothetical protein